MTDGSDDDRLAWRLASLADDLPGPALPGAAAARRRAAQRSRNQVTGGVLASVALVAVGVLISQQPTFTAAPEPVGPATDTATPTAVPTTPSQTPSTTPPTEPTPDPTDVQNPPPSQEDPDPPNPGGGSNGSEGDGTASRVPPGALLTLDLLSTEGEVEWVEVPAGDSWLPCGPGFPSTAAAASFETVDLPNRIDHVVEGTEPGAAAARLEQIRQEITTCAETETDHVLDQVWSLTGVGDGGYLMVYKGPPLTEETQIFVTASLVRHGDYITATFAGGEGMDYNFPPDADQAIQAVDLLCAALGTECPSEPERERLYPEALGDLPGWLTVEDIVAAIGVEQIAEGDEPLDYLAESGAQDWGHVGLPGSPEADGTEFFQYRFYSDPLTPGGIGLDEKIARFPDADAARAHYDELVAAADTVTEPGTEVTNTGSVSGDGYEGGTWRSETLEYESAFVYGVVLRGDTIAAVTHSIDSGTDHDVTPEQMIELMARAGERLAGLGGDE